MRALTGLVLFTAGCGGARREACETHPDLTVCVDGDAVVCAADGRVDDATGCDDGCIAGVGCGVCALEVPTDTLRLDVLPAGATWGATPLRIAGNPGATDGAVTLTLPEGVRALDAAGAAVTSVATADLPATVWLVADRPGDSTLTLDWDAGDGPCARAEIALAAARRPGLAGRPLDGAPGFVPVDAIHDGDPVEVGVDTTRDPTRIAQEADVYVVAHRDATAWGQQRKLIDVTGGAEAFTAADGMTLVTAWDAAVAEPDRVGTGYDVVIDWDRDGKLSVGDWLDGGAQPAVWALGDLTLPGPYAVAASDTSESRWIKMRVYQPVAEGLTDLPIVIISHGNGHDYRWYDYLGEHLASWGFVVMSHANNTEPGIETCSTTTLDNTSWFVTHLDQFDLDGVADVNNIAWIGHSRGGEGVVRAYHRIVEGEDTPDGFVASDIRLVSSIAPTVFTDQDTTRPHEVTYHVLAGGADGDVTGGVDCLICQYYRLSRRGTGEKIVTYLQGASHNDFNCCGFDDATGPDLIGRDNAQTLTKAWYLALLAWKQRSDAAGRDYFVRAYDEFRPLGADPDVVAAVSWSPATGYVVDDFEANQLITVSSSGAAVSFDALTPTERSFTDSDRRLDWTDADLTNGMTQADPSGGASDSGFTFGWSGPASLTFAVADGAGDVRASAGLSFRATQQTRHPDTVAPLAFSVTAVDGEGHESTLDLAEFGTLNLPYARRGIGEGAGWSNEFESYLLPWTAFDADGAMFDLADVAAIRFDFGDGASPDAGRIGLDDLRFAPEMTP